MVAAVSSKLLIALVASLAALAWTTNGLATARTLYHPCSRIAIRAYGVTQTFPVYEQATSCSLARVAARRCLDRSGDCYATSALRPYGFVCRQGSEYEAGLPPITRGETSWVLCTRGSRQHIAFWTL
jgi:hypothetical protein